MSNRIPLVLIWSSYLKEWRSYQTAYSIRGHVYEDAPAAIFLRPPTEEDLQVVGCVVKTCFMLWDLLEGSEAAAELRRCNIPLPGVSGLPGLQPKTLSQADAEAAVKAMTAQGYDYAGPLLLRLLMTCTYPEAESLLKHVGRYAEKCGPEWPEIPWEREP